MSDEITPEPDGLPDDRTWSSEMHQAALERKHALGPCSACGSHEWAVESRLFVLEALDRRGGFVPGRGVELIPVYCRRCGMMRLHAADVLLRD